MAGCRDLKPQLKILLLRKSCCYVCISSNVVVVEMTCCANVKKKTKKPKKNQPYPHSTLQGMHWTIDAKKPLMTASHSVSWCLRRWKLEVQQCWVLVLNSNVSV